MPAKTSQHLAGVLRAAGFEALAIRAETDEFHDFLSDHALPETMLDNELIKIIRSDNLHDRIAATNIRSRHHEGEFDASLEESDEWANSPDGREIFERLVKGK